MCRIGASIAHTPRGEKILDEYAKRIVGTKSHSALKMARKVTKYNAEGILYLCEAIANSHLKEGVLDLNMPIASFLGNNDALYPHRYHEPDWHEIANKEGSMLVHFTNGEHALAKRWEVHQIAIKSILHPDQIPSGVHHLPLQELTRTNPVYEHLQFATS